MAGKLRFARPRHDAMRSLMSFLVVFMGLAASIFITSISAPDPRDAVLMVIAVFAVIAAVPLLSMWRKREGAADRRLTRQRTWREFFVEVLSRGENDRPAAKIWKRKRSKFNHEPWGAKPASSVFQRESD